MPAPTDSGFIAIHGNRLEDLRQSLITFLRTAPLDPFDEDVVLVQSNGIAQWLKQSIATNPGSDASVGGLGIAADLKFQLPAEFIWSVYRSVLSESEVPKSSPYDKRPLSWRLYGLLPTLIDQPVYGPLKRFIEGEEPLIRTYQLAEKLADLYDQYQVYRADWLAHWEGGADSILSSSGFETALSDDDTWQSALWRAIYADIHTQRNQEANTSRSRVHTHFVEQAKRLSAIPVGAKLPKRVFVFGVSSLPWQTLEALALLSRFSQVIFCVLNPSRYHWAEIISDRELLTAERRRGKEKDGFEPGCQLEALHGHANPLLAGWGKQGRDFLRMLDEFDDTQARAAAYRLYRNEIDLFFPHSETDAPSLLHQIQDDIFHLSDLEEVKKEQRQLDLGSDHSVAFHLAHSPLREVEILHDQLLAAFNADPQLQPRDVMVMVPDINVYAPFIKAVFSQYPRESAQHIPFNIADLGQRGQSPLLSALEILLSLPQARCSVSEVMSLLEAPALRNRFNIAESDLELIAQWIDGTHIRWGLDADQRGSSDNPAIGARNTWLSGVQAMLVGFSLGQQEAWMDIQGYSEISGSEIAIAGNLATFVEALQQLTHNLGQIQTGRNWIERIKQLLRQFFAAEEPADELLIDRLGHQLQCWQDELEIGSGLDQEIPLLIARERVIGSMDETNLRQRFLSGSVNFSTLMPMRSIPFKIICLLGMNDGDYPRSRTPMDFDLMSREYRPGDRSRRNDDRYLFLEALLSAREKLYISWVARSILDDSERPASVLVEQLQDYINLLWSSPVADKSSSQLLSTIHPLQPFSPRYYASENRAESLDTVLKQRQLFTYNTSWRDALDRSSCGSRDSEHPLSYIQPDEPLSFKAIANFLKNPIAYFYNQRLNIWFTDLQEIDTDNELFTFSHLQKAIFESQLIQKVVQKSADTPAFERSLQQQLERWAGSGAIGVDSIERQLSKVISSNMPNLFERYCELLTHWSMSAPDQLFVLEYCNEQGTIEVADQITELRTNTEGERARIHISGSKLLDSQNKKRVRYEKLLNDWVVHLAGQLDGVGFRSFILSKEEDCCIELPQLTAEKARPLFDAIMAGWIRGMTQPLPVLPEVAYEMLEAAVKLDAEKVRDKAAAKYETQLKDYDRGYLARAYPNFESLYDSENFTLYTGQIYEPLRLIHLSARGEVEA